MSVEIKDVVDLIDTTMKDFPVEELLNNIQNSIEGATQMAQELKDSGERRVFDSGAQRDRGDIKPRPDMISPHANMREGMIFALGAEKYEPRNWEKGMPISECLASAQRHIDQWKRGDTDEDHLAQARWNLGAIIHYEEEIKAGRMDPEIDDMPKYAQQWSLRVEPGGMACWVRGDDTASDGVNRGAGEYGPWVTGYEDGYEYGCDEDKPTVYIAGPMRGVPFYNFPAFDVARNLWEDEGYNVISPADLDRKAGFDPIDNPGQDWNEDKGEVIKRDILAILETLKPNTADAIALLPGWEASKGAAVEVALGQFLGLGFVDAETGGPLEVNVCLASL